MSALDLLDSMDSILTLSATVQVMGEMFEVDNNALFKTAAPLETPEMAVFATMKQAMAGNTRAA